ncbi:MAG: hypothetical protein MJ010_00875 [Paludibacteraceae bacterium]|nr:hypothetical protein [Paludibacteraceae bacterium]
MALNNKILSRPLGDVGVAISICSSEIILSIMIAITFKKASDSANNGHKQ